MILVYAQYPVNSLFNYKYFDNLLYCYALTSCDSVTYEVLVQPYCLMKTNKTKTPDRHDVNMIVLMTAGKQK